MKRMTFSILTVASFALVGISQEPVEDSFTSLFNGKDLTGWEYGPVPVTYPFTPIRFGLAACPPN